MRLCRGAIVKLRYDCLGNAKGSIGVAYEVYTIGDKVGTSFIFENGNYDGFSEDEQHKLLQWMGCDDLIYATYNFTNVMQLSRDFQTGIFNHAFDKFRKEI